MAQVRQSKADILDAVRTITELEEDDIPDSLLELFLRDGYNRVVDLERRWPFLEVTFTLTCTAGQQAYTINDFTNDDIREVISLVKDNSLRLSYIDYDEAETQFLAVETPVGRPTFFSFWNGQIHLFPKPTENYELTVRAYRYPDDWVTAGTEPDGPAGFDLPMIYYVVARVYAWQEEVGMAQEYERTFADAISLVRRDLMRPESYSPVVLAGGRAIRRWKGTDWTSAV
jgi:hypothetical protein